MPTHSAPKLHNAMWPGLVGKGDGAGQEPAISLEKMLALTAAAAGYTVENTGPGPLVSLRYFGPDVHADLPTHGRKA